MQMHAEKRGWRFTTGFLGSGKIIITCLQCGKKGRPGDFPRPKTAEDRHSEGLGMIVIFGFVLLIYLYYQIGGIYTLLALGGTVAVYVTRRWWAHAIATAPLWIIGLSSIGAFGGILFFTLKTYRPPLAPIITLGSGPSPAESRDPTHGGQQMLNEDSKRQNFVDDLQRKFDGDPQRHGVRVTQEHDEVVLTGPVVGGLSVKAFRTTWLSKFSEVEKKNLCGIGFRGLKGKADADNTGIFVSFECGRSQ